MQRKSVVLPAPLGPSRATNSCSLTEKLTSSIARRPSKALLMPLISRRGRLSPFALARLVEEAPTGGAGIARDAHTRRLRSHPES